jgi:hypothetical protein
MLVTFCINRDHKISFYIIILPSWRGSWTEIFAIFSYFSLLLVYGTFLMDGSDVLALEGSSLLLWWFILAFSLNW